MNSYRKFILPLVGCIAAISMFGVIRLAARVKQLEEQISAGNTNTPQSAKRTGSQFIGKWRLVRRSDNGARSLPTLIEISKNGDQFLVAYDSGVHQGAAFRDGMLVMYGVVNLTYIESTGRLSFDVGEYELQK